MKLVTQYIHIARYHAEIIQQAMTSVFIQHYYHYV